MLDYVAGKCVKANARLVGWVRLMKAVRKRQRASHRRA